jgi:hypothetical protein
LAASPRHPEARCRLSRGQRHKLEAVARPPLPSTVQGASPFEGLSRLQKILCNRFASSVSLRVERFLRGRFRRPRPILRRLAPRPKRARCSPGRRVLFIFPSRSP